MSDAPPLQCGPFVLDDRLGEGGMGVVYRGIHRDEGTEAAIKVMTSRLAREPTYQQEFRREVQALAKLNHPSIATVYDYGTVDSGGGVSADTIVDGAPWFAMEYVDGVSMLDVALEWNWRQVESFLLVLLDALAHAHATEVVHRDLKPSNVLVVDDDPEQFDLEVVDFGIAHILETRDDDDAGRAPDEWGTPEIMAPEQILGEWRDQGPWTDLYAIGVVTWWVVCHRVPFSGDDKSETLLQHMSGQTGPFDPTLDVPDGLEEWLDRMLAVDHADRFRRAADAAYALVRLRRRGGSTPRGVGESSSPETTGLANLANVESDEQDARLLGLSGAPESDDTRFRPALPPIPTDWRRTDEIAEGPVRGTGLELFDLRKISLVDREEERDQLWQALHAVHQTQQPATLLLRGPAGSGKSRLAEWMARRGHELGALTVLKATHSDKGGPRDGLGPMFARFFRCTGLDWSDAVDRLQTVYESLGVDRADAFHDAVGLAEMMGFERDSDGPHPGFRAPRERHLALRRLLARLASTRPVMLWLDDIPWGWESVQFVQFLLDGSYEGTLPIVVVMTARETALAGRPEIRTLTDDLVEHDFGWDLPVEPLPEKDHRHLVERMLPLEPRVVDDIVRRTEGNPLFAIQLVGDWVERGILESGGEGFVLREDADRPIPDRPHELWKRRLRHVLEGVDELTTDRGWGSLEVAAALGRHVDDREWRAACQEMGLSAPGPLVDALVEQGLADRERGGWSFAHRMLVESLERHAHRRGNWRRCHAACAAALENLHPDRLEQTAARRAEHELEADRLEEALDPLLKAARRARRRGSFSEQRKYTERRRELLDLLGRGDDDRRRVQNLEERGHRLLETGESRRARELIERAESAARREGWVRELGDSLLLKARVARDDGEIDASLDHAEEADGCYARSNFFLGRARCHTARALALLFRGEIAEAREAFQQARSIFDALDASSDVLRAERWITDTFIHEADLDACRDRARRILERAEEIGDRAIEADAWRQLGEAARFDRKWGEARRYYQQAADRYERIGSRDLHLAELNKTMVDVPAGHYRRAQRAFVELQGHLDEVGLRNHLPPVYTGLLATAAGLENWDEFDRRIDQLEEALEEDSRFGRDAAWLADQAARQALDGRKVRRARRTYQFARDIWRQLGDRDRVDTVEERLAELRGELTGELGRSPSAPEP